MSVQASPKINISRCISDQLQSSALIDDDQDKEQDSLALGVHSRISTSVDLQLVLALMHYLCVTA